MTAMQPYSTQRYLRLQIKWIETDLEAKPMGPRVKKWTEAELARLKAELKKLNAEIRAMKMAKIQDSAKVLIQAK